MRIAVAIAASLVGVAVASPAMAAMEYDLPIGYRSITVNSASGPLEAKGAYVPVFWFGGPTRFFSLRFEAGGCYLKDPRGSAHSYAVGQTVLNFEFPIGFATPYLGVVGHAAYPIQQPSDVTGIPYGVMPQVGLKLDLAIAAVDLHAGSGPLYGLSGPDQKPYSASMTEIGAKVVFEF